MTETGSHNPVSAYIKTQTQKTRVHSDGDDLDDTDDEDDASNLGVDGAIGESMKETTAKPAKSAKGLRPSGPGQTRRVYGNMTGLEDDDSLDSDSDMLLDGDDSEDDDDELEVNEAAAETLKKNRTNDRMKLLSEIITLLDDPGCELLRIKSNKDQLFKCSLNVNGTGQLLIIHHDGVVAKVYRKLVQLSKFKDRFFVPDFLLNAGERRFVWLKAEL